MLQLAFYRNQILWIAVLGISISRAANPLEPPVADPSSGSHFVGSMQVVLSHPTMSTAIIRYTKDGTEPADTSSRFNASDPIAVEDLSLIKAKAYPPANDTSWDPSSVVSFFYIPQPAAPEVSPGDSAFFDSIVVVLSSPTEETEIYYSLDGSAPTQLYTAPLTIRQTAYLQTVALRNDWAPSDTTTAFFTRKTLAVLHEDNQSVSYLTERDVSFTLALQTGVQGVSTLEVIAFTLYSGDRDTLILQPSGSIGEWTLYGGDFPLDVANPPVVGDGQVSPALYDSIWFRWTSPENPFEQHGTVVRVRPSPKQSTLAFVDKDLKGIARLDGSEDAIYILVEDQVMDSERSDYFVRLANRLGSSPEGTADFLNVTLEELEPGRYLSTAPLEIGNFKTSDDVLQLKSYDQILAIYYDPVDGDNATGQIQFGTPVSARHQSISANTLYLKKYTGDYLKIRLPLAPNAPVILTNAKGLSHSLGNTRTSDSPTFDASHLDPGVYVLRAGGERLKILLH